MNMKREMKVLAVAVVAILGLVLAFTVEAQGPASKPVSPVPGCSTNSVMAMQKLPLTLVQILSQLPDYPTNQLPPQCPPKAFAVVPTLAASPVPVISQYKSSAP